MGIQTLKIFDDASLEFPTTYNFVNYSDANHQTPKNSVLIVIFNHQTGFSLGINYQSYKNYLFLNLIINFYSFIRKLKKSL